jgi:hypothetical protein
MRSVFLTVSTEVAGLWSSRQVTCSQLKEARSEWHQALWDFPILPTEERYQNRRAIHQATTSMSSLTASGLSRFMA